MRDIGRSILKAAAAFGGLSTLAAIAPAVSGAAQESKIPPAAFLCPWLRASHSEGDAPTRFVKTRVSAIAFVYPTADADQRCTQSRIASTSSRKMSVVTRVKVEWLFVRFDWATFCFPTV